MMKWFDESEDNENESYGESVENIDTNDTTDNEAHFDGDAGSLNPDDVISNEDVHLDSSDDSMPENEGPVNPDDVITNTDARVEDETSTEPENEGPVNPDDVIDNRSDHYTDEDNPDVTDGSTDDDNPNPIDVGPLKPTDVIINPTEDEEEPTTPEETPTVPEETPTVPEETPTTPEETPTVPEETPTVPIETPAAPEDTVTFPETPVIIYPGTPVVVNPGTPSSSSHSDDDKDDDTSSDYSETISGDASTTANDVIQNDETATVVNYGNNVTTSGTDSTDASSTLTKAELDQYVRDIMSGKYGNGDERKAALGDNYDAVQSAVNAYTNGTYVLGDTDKVVSVTGYEGQSTNNKTFSSTDKSNNAVKIYDSQYEGQEGYENYEYVSGDDGYGHYYTNSTENESVHESSNESSDDSSYDSSGITIGNRKTVSDYTRSSSASSKISDKPSVASNGSAVTGIGGESDSDKASVESSSSVTTGVSAESDSDGTSSNGMDIFNTDMNNLTNSIDTSAYVLDNAKNLWNTTLAWIKDKINNVEKSDSDEEKTKARVNKLKSEDIYMEEDDTYLMSGEGADYSNQC